ncbi:hypothetical protein N9751_00875 [Alphaproteobacteria bacterium]|nr:hypothetical protein [Alphaproteobacteria bacterium]
MKTILSFIFILFFLSNKFAYSQEFLDNKGIICKPAEKWTIDIASVHATEFKSKSSFHADYGDVVFYHFDIDDNGNTQIEIKNFLYQTTDEEIIYYFHKGLFGLQPREHHRINRVTLKRTDNWGPNRDCEVINVVRDYEVYEKTEEIHKQLKIKSDKSKKI